MKLHNGENLMATPARIETFIDRQPAPMRPALLEKAYLVNILPITWPMELPYGYFMIKPRPEGERFSVTEIDSRVSVSDIGDKRRTEVVLFASEIAADLARMVNMNAGGDSFLGVFLAAGPEPTIKELAAAHEKVETFFRKLIRNADQLYRRSKNTIEITDLDRLARQYLQLNKDWDQEDGEMQACGGCGSKVLMGVAVCKICGAVLDRAKADALGLLGPAGNALRGKASRKARAAATATQA